MTEELGQTGCCRNCGRRGRAANTALKLWLYQGLVKSDFLKFEMQ